MFSDSKAFEVGDNITIIISETASAYQKADTKMDNSTDLSLGPGTGLLEMQNAGAGSHTAVESDKFEGSGETNRSGQLTAVVTAKITEIMDNGEFRIEGGKEVIINSEKQRIKVEGYIREKDINAQNQVQSSYISDAKITYSGTGPIGDSQEPGIFSKMFAWLF